MNIEIPDEAVAHALERAVASGITGWRPELERLVRRAVQNVVTEDVVRIAVQEAVIARMRVVVESEVSKALRGMAREEIEAQLRRVKA